VSTSQKTHTIDILKTNLLTHFSETSRTRANNAHQEEQYLYSTKINSRLTIVV